jgi:hypothetical protein
MRVGTVNRSAEPRRSRGGAGRAIAPRRRGSSCRRGGWSCRRSARRALRAPGCAGSCLSIRARGRERSPRRIAAPARRCSPFDIELELEPPGLVGGFEHHRDPFPLRQPVAELAAAKLVDPVGQRVAVVPRSGARLRSGWRGPRSKHREVYVAVPLRRNLVMATTASGMSLQPPSVEATIKRRRPLRNVHKDLAEKITPLDRLALWITLRVGSMGFFLVIFGWTICWLGWNLLAPRTTGSDRVRAVRPEAQSREISNVPEILILAIKEIRNEREEEPRAAEV